MPASEKRWNPISWNLGDGALALRVTRKPLRSTLVVTSVGVTLMVIEKS